MTSVNTGLLAIAAQLALTAEGVAALCMVGAGFYFITSRGNPRQSGAAWAWVEKIGLGLLFVTGAVALTQFLQGNLKFG